MINRSNNALCLSCAHAHCTMPQTRKGLQKVTIFRKMQYFVSLSLLFSLCLEGTFCQLGSGADPKLKNKIYLKTKKLKTLK